MHSAAGAVPSRPGTVGTVGVEKEIPCSWLMVWMSNRPRERVWPSPRHPIVSWVSW